LAEKIKGDFGLGKEFVPKGEREIVGNPSKYAEEVRFEVANCHFGCIAAMAAWWDKFECHLVCVPDEVFHCRGDLIVQDMFARCDSGQLEAEHQCRVSSGEFGISAILDGLNKDGATVNFHHNHDVFVACSGALGKFACLVGKNGVAHMVYLCVDILDFVSPELGGVHLFKGRRFGFGGAYVLASLAEVSFGCLDKVGVVLLHVLGCQEWPTYKVAGVDGFEPCGPYWVATDGVHPFDGLFCGWKVIDAVGLAEGSACLFG
jgi:hypothetical protein